MDKKQEGLEPLTPEELERIKNRDPTKEPLTPREWERLRQQRQRPEYSET